MKINDSVITITSHQEVLDWFYSPTAWDISPGKLSAAAIAIAYNVFDFTERDVETNKPTLVFETDGLAAHWNALRSSCRFVRYSLEENSQRDIEDWNYEYRKDDNVILLAAQYVYNAGMENFTFDFEDGEDCSMVIVTNKNNNKKFTIKDTEDLEMYFAFLRVVNSMNEAVQEKSREEELREFIS